MIRATPSGRLRITGTVYETPDRPFESLTIQRWDGENQPLESVSLNAEQTIKFIEFVHRIKTTSLEVASKFKIYDKHIGTVITGEDIDLAKLEAAAKHDPAQAEVLAKFVEEFSLRDLKAIAYRRGELAHFERLLRDEAFRDEQRATHGGPEKLWQAFFERNPWIFGYGLTYLPLRKLDGRALEQFIQGRSIAGFGKEADAIMKSNALISGLTVVEIKTPYELRTLGSTFRAGGRLPSVIRAFRGRCSTSGLRTGGRGGLSAFAFRLREFQGRQDGRRTPFCAASCFLGGGPPFRAAWRRGRYQRSEISFI